VSYSIERQKNKLFVCLVSAQKNQTKKKDFTEPYHFIKRLKSVEKALSSRFQGCEVENVKLGVVVRTFYK
jgi:hypothetical protein